MALGDDDRSGTYNGAKILSFIASIQEKQVEEIWKWIKGMQESGKSQEEIRAATKAKYKI